MDRTGPDDKAQPPDSPGALLYVLGAGGHVEIVLLDQTSEECAAELGRLDGQDKRKEMQDD